MKRRNNLSVPLLIPLYENIESSLDFWARWRPPCRAEIPSLVELQKQHAKQGLAVVGVSADQDGAAVVETFAQKYGMIYRE
ncbi:MAG: TlpA family protein disulfide reductase [Verrucomicrobia bacterium]|nr:TlpA family protein disulfide reductase [Verrucomicrobiota bacterium]MDE3100094.1 TlpA family protein disulfide reductase [Verrucomicrobiota bacterium]